MNKSKSASAVTEERNQNRDGKVTPKIKKEKRANFKQNWRNLLDKMEE